MKKHITLQTIIKEELKDPEFKKYYEKEQLINALAERIAALRRAAKLTQAELAEMVGTRQSVISRLESGHDSRMPSLDLLARIASATGKHLTVQFH
jgi:ribosome-binding protein aMBF1 (putative translation factor)